MKAAVVVTGASRSFGRCLALDFARELRVDAHALDLYLWARDERELHETARLAQVAWSDKSGSGELRTIVQAVDLGDKSDYVPKIDALIAQLEAGSYDRLFLVHNAGSLGELGFTNEWSSQEILSQYWEFNLTSVCWLNKRFLDAFGASRDELLAADAAAPVESPTPARSVIVNITSLCGIKPFETYSLYCTGKAAREMHHQVIAAEQAASDKVRVLSYSPGPMDTGMQQVFRESPMVHPKLAKNYITMKAEGTLVPPEKSSRRGVLLTLSGAFETGAHVDYYELEHLG